MDSRASAATNLNSDTMINIVCAQKVVDSTLDLVARLEEEQRETVVHVVAERRFVRCQSDLPQHAAVRRVVQDKSGHVRESVEENILPGEDPSDIVPQLLSSTVETWREFIIILEEGRLRYGKSVLNVYSRWKKSEEQKRNCSLRQTTRPTLLRKRGSKYLLRNFLPLDKATIIAPTRLRNWFPNPYSLGA